MQLTHQIIYLKKKIKEGKLIVANKRFTDILCKATPRNTHMYTTHIHSQYTLTHLHSQTRNIQKHAYTNKSYIKTHS